MKLPGITYQLSVQDLGREDVGAPARQWAADQKVRAASMELVDTAAQLTGKFVQAQEDEGARQRSLQVERRLQENYNIIANKQSYDLDNPDDARFLEGIKYSKYDGEGNPKRIISSHEVMSQVWEKQRDKIMQDGFVEMSPYQQKKITEKVNPYLFKTNGAIQLGNIQATNDYMRNVATQNIQDVVDTGNMERAYEEIDASVPFTDAERAELRAKADIRHEANKIEKAMFAPDKGEAAMAYADYLESAEYDGPLTAEQRDASAGRLRRQAVEKRAEITAAEEKQKNLFLSNLEIGIVKGQFSELDVEKAYMEGRMDEGTRTRLTKLAINEAGKRVSNDNAAALVLGAINNGVTLNPYDSDTQKAVNSFVETLDPASPTYTQDLYTVTIKTGFMPQALENIITGGIVNGTEEQAGEALKIYSNLLDNDQGTKLVGFMPSQIKDTMDAASYFYRSGAPSATAAMAQAKEIMNVKPEIYKQRQDEYAVVRKDKDAASELKSMMEHDSKLFNVEWNFGFGRIADVTSTSNMIAEYAQGTELYYAKTGDMELAKQMAYQNIQRTWGITEVGNTLENGVPTNKKRAMKYPIERTANLTKDQADAAILGYSEAYGINPDNMVIISDSYTARDHSTWQVMVIDPETGFPVNPSTINGDPESDRFEPHRWVKIGQESLWQSEAADYKSEHEAQMRKEQFRAKVKEQAAKRGYRGADTVDIYEGVGW